MGRRKKNKPIKLKIEADTSHSIVAVFLMLVGLLILVSFSGQGLVLSEINTFLVEKLGLGMLFLPLIFISSGLVMLRAKWKWAEPNVLLGLLVLTISFSITFKTGQIGSQTFLNLSRLLSPVGTYITAAGLMVVGFLIILQSSLVDLIEQIQKWSAQLNEKRLSSKVEKQKKQLSLIPKISLGRKDREITVSQANLKKQGIGDDQTGTAVVSSQKDGRIQDEGAQEDRDELKDKDLLTPSNLPLVWDYPPLSLLSETKGGEADRGDVNQNADIIETTLESFGIQAGVKEVNFGPSITQYALEVSRGTKLSRITSLSTDLAMALAAPTGQIRIEAPIAGRNLVGIEVPNRSFEFVTLKEILGSSALKKHPSKLAVGLGIDVAGNSIIADIAQMPHLLIAGATGSGKSICINNFLSSLLFRASPSELNLVLVDPKRVELTQYQDIPHLITPVIVEPKKVISALKWTENLMEKRYKLLQEVGVKDIQAYNELAGLAAMPNLIIVIDEMADIMMFAPGDVEASVTRIAQMARAVGIHLVLSTQRPSVDVITGLIKANISARIAFQVSSLTDSRVILDSPGAEKLLGRGDMLYQAPDKAKPIRVQGTFVSPRETTALIDYLKSHGHKPDYEDEITTKFKPSKTSGLDTAEEKDELFEEAVQVFTNQGKASASLLQRRLSIGYNRAARILDQLYHAGLIGPPEGSKPREVNKAQLQAYLAKKNN
jgi:S-DNA-T family DNA segregation ATPase FtsK/SpoIIIE